MFTSVFAVPPVPPPVRGARALLFLLVGGLACTSTAEPRSGITLLVANGTCQTGACTPIQVLAFPTNQPHTPGGFWRVELGLVDASSACLTIPPSATFRVIGVSGDGRTADTTTYTWTPADSVWLGVLLPSEPPIFASPSTRAFVPTSAPGWRLTLPGDSPPSPTSACTP